MFPTIEKLKMSASKQETDSIFKRGGHWRQFSESILYKIWEGEESIGLGLIRTKEVVKEVLITLRPEMQKYNEVVHNLLELMVSRGLKQPL